jgi:ATP-dependent helicase/nuclease subunit B
LAGLEALVRRYAEDGAGYLSRPYAQYARKYAPYDHLARVKEWSVTGGGETDG